MRENADIKSAKTKATCDIRQRSVLKTRHLVHSMERVKNNNFAYH
jgi:hypothetical protein